VFPGAAGGRAEEFKALDPIGAAKVGHRSALMLERGRGGSGGGGRVHAVAGGAILWGQSADC
jgi:hypothetical protein